MVIYWKDLDTIRARYEIIHPRALLKWWNPGLRGILYNLSSNAHFKDKLNFNPGDEYVYFCPFLSNQLATKWLKILVQSSNFSNKGWQQNKI